MKIGIIFKPNSNEYARFGDLKFKKIREHGFSAIDYSMINTEAEPYTLDGEEFENAVKKIKDDTESAGIVISQVHGPWRYPPMDAAPEDRADRMENMKRSISAAAMLGCKYWVVHPLMPYGTDDLKTGNSERTWESNIKFMSELLEHAKSEGVTICLENMPMLNFSIATPKKILEFVRLMDDDNFKVCLDTGHVAVFPDISIGDTVRELGEDLKVLHVHDNMGDKDAHMWPTKGSVNWHEFISALREINFDGVFSLETAPQGQLDNSEFEKAGRELYEIAKKITET